MLNYTLIVFQTFKNVDWYQFAEQVVCLVNLDISDSLAIVLLTHHHLSVKLNDQRLRDEERDQNQFSDEGHEVKMLRLVVYHVSRKP